MSRSSQFYTRFVLILIISWLGTLLLSQAVTAANRPPKNVKAQPITKSEPKEGKKDTTGTEAERKKEDKSGTEAEEERKGEEGGKGEGEEEDESGSEAEEEEKEEKEEKDMTTGAGATTAKTVRRPIGGPPAVRSPLRLANGSSPMDGRVEVFHNGQWGTVCDDDADINVCIVVCRQLRFSGGKCMNEGGGDGGCESKATILFGEGQGPIWIDDIKCIGVESNIDECLKSNWGVTNCLHKEDLACLCDPGSGGSGIRLVNGKHPYEGRVEVFHKGQWGTICDDYASVNACRVICRQLNHLGGECVNENGGFGCKSHSESRFGLATGTIWIDELVCTGTERSIEECRKRDWGDVNCHHKEDLGCICSSLSSDTPGVCDPSRHRLRANDPSVPGVGRVEVRDPVTNSWGIVCDDSWTDINANVFCLCLGYTEQMYFHSLFNQPMINVKLPLLYDAVDCLPGNVVNRTSLFDCATEPATPGRCDAEYEAAYVACTAFPNITDPESPAPNVTCQGTMLSACFQLSKGVAKAAKRSDFHLNPICSTARVDLTSDELCYHIDFTVCMSAPSPSTNTTKPYCYDISYSTFDQNPNTLITDHTWSTRVCCAIDRNASAIIASFHHSVDELSHDTSVRLSEADQRAVVNYSIQCFTDSNFSGVPLKFPAVVYRGMEMFCAVKASTWDHNLFLVVTGCQFLTSLDAPEDNAHQYIVKDKCTTALGENIGLRLYSIDDLRWGLRFHVPKFQGSDLLYMSCSTSVCDKRLDPKPDCDRSCVKKVHPNKKVRPKRQLQDDLLAGSRSQRSADDKQVSNHSRDKTDIGPFIIWGVGQDYFISEDEDLLVYRRTSTEVPAKLSPSSVAHRQHTSMTQPTLVLFLAAVCLLFL